MSQPFDPNRQYPQNQSYPQQPSQYPPPQQPQYPQVKPLPPGWQQPIQPGQWDARWSYTGIHKVKQPVQNKWYLYFIPGAGALLTFVCVFLPWVSVNFLGVSVFSNGIGGISGPPGFIDAMSKISSPLGPPTLVQSPVSNSFTSRDGYIVLVISLIACLLVLGGLLQKSKVYSTGIFIIGLVSIGIFGYEIWNTNHAIDYAYKQAGLVATNGMGIDMGAGLGLYIGVVGSLALILGSGLVYFLCEKEK